MPVDRARVGLLATSHAVDDIYQGAVPALLPFFIAGRHYSYTAATELTFAATGPVVGDPAGLRRAHRPPQPALAGRRG
jgi:hypothetical protein